MSNFDERFNKLTKLLEKKDIDSRLCDIARNSLSINSDVVDILILACEKGWSADDLYNDAKTILALHEIN